MKNLSLRHLLCLATVAIAGSANAHGLWIEQTGATKTLFFGEPENALKEVSPGRLDSIKAPRATAAGGERKAWATPPRTPTGFDLGQSPALQGVLATETTMEVTDWTRYGIGIIKPVFHARYAPAPLKATLPELELDIVPTGAVNTFRVTYQGKPLNKTKVIVIAPNTWSKEASSDEQGQVVVSAPWRGQYVLQVTHVDKTPGQFDGKPYEASRHRAMLTFEQAGGE